MTSRSLEWGALAVCAAVVLTGCGSDGSDDTSGGLTGEPVRVGFLDPSLAADASPDVSAASKAAEEYINTEVGGIDGRPLELVVCKTDTSAEKDLACANDLAGSDVIAVVDGFDKGSGAALPVLDSAGIPLIGGVPSNGIVNASQTSFYTGTDQASFAIAPLLAFKEQNAKRVVLALPEAPTSHTYVDSFLTPIAEKFGLDFSVTYYDGASPDFASVAATAKAEKADIGGVVSMRDESQCTQMVQAFADTGFDGAVLAGACTQFIEAMGEAAAGAQVYSSIWMPQMSKYAPEEIQTRLADAEKLLQKHNDGNPAGFYGYATFNTIVALAQALNESGQSEFTAQGVSEIMGSLKDFPTFLGPEITCDHSVWPNSSSCSNKMIIAEVQEDGSVKPIFDEVFLELSPDQLPG